jgi:hypothetical protein
MTKPSSHLQWLYGNPDIASRVETPTSDLALNGYNPADIPTSKNFNFYLYTLDEWDKWAESELDLKAPLNSPTLVTPNLGTPSAGILTNCSGLPLAGTTGTLPVDRGGTGATTSNAALNALLPSQASANGKVLASNGTDASWAAALTSVLASASIFVGNASNVATAVAMSGVISLSNAGVTAFAGGDFGSVAVKSSDSVTTPYLYGSSSASGTLELQSTSHGTKGAINFGASGAFGSISSTGSYSLGGVTDTPYNSYHTIYKNIYSGTPSTATNSKGSFNIGANAYVSASAQPTRTTGLGGCLISFDTSTNDTNAGLTFQSNLAADGATTSATIKGQMAQSGAWLFGGSSMTITPVTIRGYSTLRGSGSTNDGEIKLGTNSSSGAKIQHYDGGPTITSIDNLNDDAGAVFQIRMRTAGTPVTVLSATGAGVTTLGHSMSAVPVIVQGYSPVGGASTANGAIQLGSDANARAQFHYDSDGYTTTYLDSCYNSSLAAMKFRLRTAGTPVTPMTLAGTGAVTLGPDTGAGSGTGTDALEHAVYGAINIKPQTSASSAGGSTQSHDFTGMSYVAGATYLVTISAYRSTNAADYAIWQQLAVERTSGSFALFDVFPYASAGGVDLANIALSRSGSVITVSCDSSATSSGIVNMRVGLIRHG